MLNRKFSDEYFMRIALTEARKGKGLTYPNPAVGAVIVSNNQIIGRGYHRRAGLAHAEVEAVNAALKKCKTKIPQNSKIYITLEPCCHYGKTPPCVDLLINHKFKEVIVGSADPNPLVNGKGLKKLETAGISVKTDVLRKECDVLNEDFFYSIQNKKSFITIKSALTLDGKIASITGDSKWITNEKSRKFAHYLRQINSILLTGINTILKDNPQFNIRNIKSPKHKMNIAVMDTNLDFPMNAKLLAANSGAKIIIFTAQKNIDSAKCKKLIAKNIDVIPLKLTKDQTLDIKTAVDYLYQNGFNSILVESGGKLVYSLLKNKLANKIHLMFAPKLLGKGIDCIDGLLTTKIENCLILENISITHFDENFMVTGYINYGS